MSESTVGATPDPVSDAASPASDGLVWYPASKSAHALARVTAANIPALASLSEGTVYPDDGNPTLSVTARIKGYHDSHYSNGTYATSTLLSPGMWILDLGEQGWGGFEDGPGTKFWFANAADYTRMREIEAVANDALKSEPAPTVLSTPDSTARLVAELIERIEVPRGADPVRFRRSMTTELTRSIDSGFTLAELEANLGLSTDDTTADTGTIAAPDANDTASTNVASADDSDAPAPKRIWKLGITSYRGISFNAEHYYGTIRAISNDADAEVQHVLTRPSARALNRKESLSSKIYAPGMFSNRFDSREQVVEAAIAIFTHIAGDDDVLLLEDGRFDMTPMPVIAPQAVRDVLEPLYRDWRDLENVREQMPLHAQNASRVPAGYYEAEDAYAEALHETLPAMGYLPSPTRSSSADPRTRHDCAVRYDIDGTISEVLDTEDKDYDLAFTDWDDGEEFDHMENA